MNYKVKCLNASIKINFAKMYNDVKIPTKRDEDAGFDIYARFEEDYICIPPHETKLIPTGLISACDKGYYFQLFERGSTGTKGIAQRCGVIDSGYRDEWFIPITNTTNNYLYIIKKGVSLNTSTDSIIYPYEKAICQAVILPVPKTEVQELTIEEIKNIKSLRGEGKLGSSNK